MTTLRDTLTAVSGKCPEAGWLVTEDDPGAAETFQLLEIPLQRLSRTKREALLREVLHGDEKNVVATLRELVAYEWLHRLSLNPIYRPDDFRPMTPDLAFEVGSKTFLADVFVSFNPSRTVWFETEYCLGTKDSGDRAKNIADRLTEKYHKYKKVVDPMVFLVFHGDHIVKSRDAALALYGASMGDPNLAEDFPWGISSLQPPGGFFLPDEDGNARHERVSAVIWCDWFATQNIDLPGRRLHTLAYHHWKPAVPIAPGSFSPFPELIWNRANGSWEPELTESADLVGRFAVDGSLKVGEYSSDRPW